MILQNFDKCNIAALACAVPANIQKANLDPNHPNAAYISSFVRQIGVKERHISFTEQTALDMAIVASKAAIRHAGLNVSELDGVIFLTQTPDLNQGTGNSFLLHYCLGMEHSAFAFDISLGCAAFPYGLSVALSYLQQENIHNILLINGDTKWNYSPSLEFLKGEYCFLHGEGATALVLTDKGVNDTKIALCADGSGYKYLFNPAGGIRNKWRVKQGLTRTSNGVKVGQYMDGIEITSFSTDTVVDSIKEFMAEISTTNNDYDALVLHQANKQIIKTIARRLNFPTSKIPVSLDRYGNTDGASPTLTICDGLNREKVPNQKLRILCSAFGLGLSWGICDFYINTNNVLPIMTVEDNQFTETFLTS